MATEGLVAATTHRAEVFGRAFLAVAIDLIFVGGVVLLNWAAQKWVFERLVLHGSVKALFVVLEWAFTISTMATVIGYLIHDCFVAIVRPWRAER